MNVLLLGGRGRLAAALARAWSGRHEVQSVARPEVDVADSDGLRRFLDSAKFDVLVNGTGATNVDACETERDAAVQVNVTAPAIMAAAARARGARFIHFSTDYVFDGKIEGALDEDAPAAPLGWYGQTKRDGEVAVLADGPSHLVVRVSWVFGPDKPSFVDMILDRAKASAEVSAVADKYSSPTYAVDVADWVEPFFDPALPGGLYHACNGGGCSWREYGEYALQAAANLGVPLLTTTVAPVPLSDMKQFKAPRPVHTILSTAKLSRVTGLTPRPWQEAVEDYVRLKYAPVPPAA